MYKIYMYIRIFITMLFDFGITVFIVVGTIVYTVISLYVSFHSLWQNSIIFPLRLMVAAGQGKLVVYV